MIRVNFAAVVLASAALAGAADSRFSLNISATTNPRSLSAGQEAQLALWNDPMIRLGRAMDAEFGHFLLGQPGGRTPPLIMVGIGGGLSPRLLRAAFENSLNRSTEPPPAVIWPWLKNEEPAPPPMEEQLALLLGERLERRLGSRADP